MLHISTKTIKAFVLFLLPLTFTSCHDKEDEEITTTRTVVVYMSAENELGSYGFLNSDYNEILEGSTNLPDNVRLLLYIDKQDSDNPPYIALIDKNKSANIVKQYPSDFYSSSPTKMKEVLSWCFSKYPAQSYGLVLWGHGNSWLIEPDSKAASSKANNKHLNAYGADTGNDNTDDVEGAKWMNITQMADALSGVPHLDFIFFDCCCMQSVEVAYELKDVTDYIIGSPAEIPGQGAPYNYIVPEFFANKASVGKNIVDNYIEYGNFGSNSGLPMSVVYTGNIDNFAQATQNALSTIMPSYQYPANIPLDSLIYYYSDDQLSAGYNINYDMRNFMKRYLSSTDYATWNNTFNQTVVYSRHPADIHTTGKKDWMTNASYTNIDFSSFYLTDENYGGLSMFIPQTYYANVRSPYLNPNSSIFLTKWSNVVNWSKWGW